LPKFRQPVGYKKLYGDLSAIGREPDSGKPHVGTPALVFKIAKHIAIYPLPFIRGEYVFVGSPGLKGSVNS
jgi:hypothetical protein